MGIVGWGVEAHFRKIHKIDGLIEQIVSSPIIVDRT
jgi:hypothetical protein